MEAPQSREELETNLNEYRSQLKQVEELLLMGDQVNDEMQEMYNSLTEVIQLTEELLREAIEVGAAQGGAGTSTTAPGPSYTSSDLDGIGASHSAAGAGTGAGAGGSAAGGSAAVPNLPSILPASVAEQIRKAQIRAALNGQAPVTWLIGAKVQAIYSDGQHYDAMVEGVTSGGKLLVMYEGYQEKDEVPLSNLRERPEQQEVYRGVAAPKRKRVEEQEVVAKEFPKWLEIKPGVDDEKTIARKKKLIKSYKSKIRFQEMDLTTKKKQDNWKDFMTGKATKKKTGFFTGHKKESIFAVPEGVNSKVGVVGSGKAMTQYQKAKRVDATTGEEIE